MVLQHTQRPIYRVAPERLLTPTPRFGVESGLFSFDGGATYFDVCAVSLYDGVSHHLGLSCAFQVWRSGELY